MRELILQAALDIVVREGFAELSMRKIADAIEYSPATLYLHFESRDAIAYQLCTRGYAEFARELLPAVATESEPVAQLRVLSEGYIQFGLDHPETYRLIFMTKPEYANAVTEGNDEESAGMQVFMALINAFEALRASGKLASALPSQALAELLWAGLHGVVSLKLTCPLFTSATAQEQGQQMLDAQLHGLLKPA
ncbi:MULTISPECIES: TetR/AcrR family transcriptional regulator [Silvimonas]|uniref:TetR/AcrR family transcriptional regulator n=1 Tax=Silvimonas TaxID=300264 RepID=UPI0024B345B7|nr:MULTISPECIES: TetR/AcrR family transcriptional regulator [Silvimonas]MDR3426642.1 TetR/AcrR family transcriptional regulator [Silvimonas sp.]